VANSKIPSGFITKSCSLKINNGLIELSIAGQKIGPPSKKITLLNSKLRVVDCTIEKFEKKDSQSIQISRINYLPTMNQIRIHSSENLFPGHYQLSFSVVVSEDITKIITADSGQNWTVIKEHLPYPKIDNEQEPPVIDIVF
jgi:hypothetical protein